MRFLQRYSIGGAVNLRLAVKAVLTIPGVEVPSGEILVQAEALASPIALAGLAAGRAVVQALVLLGVLRVRKAAQVGAGAQVHVRVLCGAMTILRLLSVGVPVRRAPRLSPENWVREVYQRGRHRAYRRAHKKRRQRRRFLLARRILGTRKCTAVAIGWKSAKIWSS